MNNIIKTKEGTLIVNGGNPTGDCPTDWEDAYQVIGKLNKELVDEALTNEKHKESPKWSFDCGFKLDFDGSLLMVSSRFYPPKTHYGPNWDGDIEILCHKNGKLAEKHFECETLEELKTAVHTFMKNLKISVNISIE